MRQARSAAEWDESDVRVRPNRHGSRPRTKDRPSYAGAVPAVVIAVDRGRWRTLAQPDTDDEREVTAVRARALGRSPIVPGDRVFLTGDVTGRPDTLGRIVRISERRSLLRRSADDADQVERVIVANADQMVVVTALADPAPRPRMIDRCLVAAFDAGLDVVLCLTKSDLAPPDELLALYEPLGVSAVVTSWSPDPGTAEHQDDATHGDVAGLSVLRGLLEGRTSVFIGHSGVGKSTLVNALVPDAGRATGHVNAVTGRGRHTSSSALALRLPDRAGWVIDTPGVRSFGLGHVDPENVLAAFEDLAPLALDCPRGCRHLPGEPGCALEAGVKAGLAGPSGPARLESYRRLAETLAVHDTY